MTMKIYCYIELEEETARMKLWHAQRLHAAKSDCLVFFLFSFSLSCLRALHAKALKLTASILASVPQTCMAHAEPGLSPCGLVSIAKPLWVSGTAYYASACLHTGR